LKVLKVINLTEHILGIFLPVNWRQNPIPGATMLRGRNWRVNQPSVHHCFAFPFFKASMHTRAFFLSLKEKL
jgi:hypothetical protein